MIVLMNTGGIATTNCFLVADEDAKQAVLFDAPDGTAGRVLDEAKSRGWDVIGLWLTHGHFDHIADHPEVSSRFPDAKVLIHRLDEPKLLRPNSSIFALPFTIPPRRPDGYLEDGQSLSIGSLNLTVIHTPGHAPGAVCFYSLDLQCVFTGDTLFHGGPGATGRSYSDRPTLVGSIRAKLMALPPETVVHTGHGEDTTIGAEAGNLD